ncbi:MAG: LamG domain-containing protein, partial [Bacteroidia bacterium]
MKKTLLLIMTSVMLLGSFKQAQAQAGAALNFDGVDDYVSVGNILPASYTKEAWIYITNSGGQQNIVSGGSDGQHALWAPNQVLSAGHNGAWSTVQDVTTLNLNQWYHVAVTYDASAQIMTLYKNGVQVSQASGVVSYNSGNMVRIGSYDPAQNLFHGNIDEVRIWNRALCQAEIQNNMNAELQLPQIGLVSYYNFNEGFAALANPAVTTLNDISGNGINGTLTNFALTGATSNWVAPGAVTSGVNAPVFPLGPAISIVSTATVLCNGGGTATLTASGASTYVWSGGPATAAYAVSPTVTTSYSVVGTNSVGCISNTAVSTVTVSPVINASSTASSILCNGGVASVTVSATGGTGSLSGTGTFTATAGSYTYTVTDANSCSATTTVTITEPTVLTASSTASSILCNGGVATVTVSATGGTGSLSGTGTFTATAGSYTYTVTDANSCSATTTVTITEPAVLTMSVSGSPILCHGGTTSATVTANGGTTPYSSGVGNYTVHAGTYPITVTDNNGCTISNTVTISQPSVLTASITADTLICNGGTTSLTITATGGTPTYMGVGTFTSTAGFHVYTITDNNNCSTTKSVSIINPAAISSTQSPTVCSGQSIIVGSNTYTANGTYTDILTS